ncbi:MAG: hypothetical protein ACXW4Q_08070 [Anaerolineales bacterium]
MDKKMTSNQPFWLLVIYFWKLRPIPQTGRDIRLTTLSACAG